MQYLFEGAEIYTFCQDRPKAEAMVVESGIIKAVGQRKELAEQFPKAKRISVGGAAVVPAFNDCHCHILLTGLDLEKADLKGATSNQEIVNRLREHASQKKDQLWILGVSYDQNILPGGRHITRAELDLVSRDRPVFIKHTSGHCIIGNSKALSLAGVTADTPDPSNGLILRDEAGEPTGVLLEGARTFAESCLPVPTVSEMASAIKVAAERMASVGTLSATDCSFGRYGLKEEWQAYIKALAEGAPIRITLMPRVIVAQGAGWLERANANLPGGHPDLRLGAMKFFLDGAVLPRTAVFKEPYADGARTAVMMYQPEEYKGLFLACHQGGWQIATHAIGDAAIELAVEAAELAQAANPRTQARHRIEHCMLTNAEIIKRMARLGMIAVPQPEFIYHFGDKYFRALGQRAERSMPCRSWLKGGVKVAFGSDQPVVSHDPIIGWRAAVDRKTRTGQVIGAGEGLDPLTALRCFTLEAALAGLDDEIGVLAPGRKADFVVLSGRPENILAEQIKVTATSRDLIKPG